MTKLQGKKLRFLQDKLDEAMVDGEEIKNLEIRPNGSDSIVFNALVGVVGDENNILMLKRWRIQMFIGPRGGVHYYDSETDIRKTYKGGNIKDGAFFYF